MSLVFRIIAILQIAGGFYGLLQTLPALLAGRASMVVVIGIVLFALALVAGVMLLEGHAAGVRLSRLVQLLQIPLLASPVFSYGWHVGARLPATLRLSPSFALNLDWAVPTQGLRLEVGGTASIIIGVNLLALVLWWLLWRLR